MVDKVIPFKQKYSLDERIKRLENSLKKFPEDIFLVI